MTSDEVNNTVLAG